MRFKSIYVLFISALIAINACSDDQTPQGIAEDAKIDTLQISELDIVVDKESNVLGEPREIVYMDEKHFAVYDHGYQKMMVFDTAGVKLYEFGNTGRGPGEWDPMSGAVDLNFRNNQFLTTNQEELKLDLYDREGNHLQTIPYSHYPRYSRKVWFSDDELLVSTLGKEDALAVVTALDDEDDIKQRIGAPPADYKQRANLDQERQAYVNGEVPKSAQNDALVAKTEDGFLLFINALGEIRKYSNEGELIFTKVIPSNIKDAIFDYVIQRNKELDSPGVVVPLQYAKDIQVKNDLLFIFLPKQGLDDGQPDTQVLIYDLQGNLKQQMILADPQQNHFLYDLIVNQENTIYFIDVMNAQILRHKLELN